ncbi:hypothetical protein [Oceanobacillus bengalensis]|uniref:Uncharacterized protein n=1 Tax=Oceanobacillus bengalensis TaxID=1435466 RepID=A0A494YUC7_9BACI|nr:hypothetical protein [Oceanobacillus bengalensis]RKQ13618.1 hypothetical protein D8M05_15405 [Oceanobacillus bengalensis]
MGERKIYILLSDTGTLFTRMIKLYTKKPYNHASISFDPYFTEVYSFGRKQPHNPFIGGFVREDIRDGLFTHARGAIYSCTATDEQIRYMLDYIKKIEAQKHLYRYNLLGLFFLTFNKRMDRKHAFFCSEFVATVLNKGNVVQFDKALSFVTPHDFHEVDTFQLEYQGDLADIFSVENQFFFNTSIIQG